MLKYLKIIGLIILFFCFTSFQEIVSQNQSETFLNFKVTTLNTEWLSCNVNGPSDDALQINNIAALIKTLNSDVIALQEVGTSASYATIDTLVKKLGDDWGGNIVTWNDDNCKQNQGIIYKKSKVQFVNSSLITSGGSYYNWSSGRYPALYNLSFIVDGETVPVALINIHAKAYNDENSYDRRKGASQGLKTLLDGNSYNTKDIILLGDFNDYLVGSQCTTESNSPYKNFMDDTSDYLGLTSSLIDTYYHNPVIDNIIISNELFDNYVENSVTSEIAATQTISNFRYTTTDHMPISATFKFSSSSEIYNPVNNSAVTLYPNPVTNYVTVKSDASILLVTVYNLAGMRLLNLQNGFDNIDVSSLQPGVYILQVVTEQGYSRMKFIKS